MREQTRDLVTTMESRSRLKQRLTRLFRPSTLLRTSCNSTTSGSIFTSSATNTSGRSLSTAAAATDMIMGTSAHEPVFIPDDSLFIRNNSNKLDRSLSFSSSSRMLSLDCSGCRPTKSSETDVVSVVSKVSEKKTMKKKERRVRATGESDETGGREGRTCPPISDPLSPSKGYYFDYCGFDKIDEEEDDLKTRKKDNVGAKNVKKKKNKFVSNAYGFSSSSDDDGSEFFSSDEVIDNEDETETFFSSRSFSSDSSEFYKRPSSRKKKKKSKKKDEKQIKSSRRPPSRGKKASYEEFRPAVSVSMSEEHEEEKSGIPVMKRSTDPYVDFRDSMAEMIVERQIFGAKDLERLLHSYLSLNSPHHHAVILRAFADISEDLSKSLKES